jgi:pimeloyl-ACP methyl ester carboxylesterase
VTHKVSQHESRIAGRTFTYSAEAARLPIRDMESGRIRGYIFYVAYRVPTGNKKPRPVLFAWGGGPSGPSLGMQMAYGPKTVTDDGRLVDNELSLLSVADLVFVDPVGTGFSRPRKPEYLDEFYSTNGDARATSEFIRVWIAMNDAELAPLFLNGQSYGVWRAAFTAELLEQTGRHVTGLVLTSGGTGMADEFTQRAYEIALRVPDYAATAFHHGRLPAEFGDSAEEAWRLAEAWARETYGPALSRIDALTNAERESIAHDLSRRTGYPLDRIDRDTLAFTPPRYLRDFTGDEDTRLDLFDMRRIAGADVNGGNPVRDRAQAQFLREHLGYRTDLAYIGLETGYTPVTSPDYQPAGARWNYDSGTNSGEPPPDGGPPGKEPWVRRAIESNPDLQVFVEAAVYDSLNFCAANEDRKRRMPPDVADNFELHCYFAGHGSFRDPDGYPLLVQDIRNFIIRAAE